MLGYLNLSETLQHFLTQYYWMCLKQGEGVPPGEGWRIPTSSLCRCFSPISTLILGSRNRAQETKMGDLGSRGHCQLLARPCRVRLRGMWARHVGQRLRRIKRLPLQRWPGCIGISYYLSTSIHSLPHGSLCLSPYSLIFGADVDCLRAWHKEAHSNGSFFQSEGRAEVG